MENPYWLALANPELGYLTRIAAFTALFAGLSKAVEWVVASARPEGGVSSALAALSDPSKEGKARSGAQAASTVLSMVHALGTSAASIWTVQALLRGGAAADPEAVARLWSWALAYSQGYFIADGIYNALSEHGETWVLWHHAWMTLAHHPIGALSRGCMLMGCGDCSLAVWLSATGYLSEISTVFLNIRWFQHRWLRQHSIWYTINMILVLVTYPLARVIIPVPFILAGSLWPRWAEYQKQGLGSLVVFTSVTYSALTLMSMYFLYTLVNRGLHRALTLRPCADKGD
ncbi:unnamed protein product [Polarella glacialis]|uniref:TLC domain-containing protein n=1 Tax=Polarella glacialis TaxID=89957 RepID=A0A813FE91_POLGL|nr:unnamed protein product [Polarella glacialis]|mmetsp:Transcript_30836/g.55179  ORF Transcript_30836/g.55179 Transcript_30836/m.55179 type:complete len:288 (+) Transcript_30836:90-953(+)